MEVKPVHGSATRRQSLAISAYPSRATDRKWRPSRCKSLSSFVPEKLLTVVFLVWLNHHQGFRLQHLEHAPRSDDWYRLPRRIRHRRHSGQHLPEECAHTLHGSESGYIAYRSRDDPSATSDAHLGKVHRLLPEHCVYCQHTPDLEYVKWKHWWLHEKGHC